jgi:hypothetical protein
MPSCNQSVSPAVLRRVMRELSELENNPPEGIRIQTSDEDMLDVTGIIEGPGTSISISILGILFANFVHRGNTLCWRILQREV